MGQGELIKFLEKNPRLTTREIANALEYSMERASFLIQKMVGHGEIIEDIPTKEETKRIVDKFPKIVHGLWNVKVFIVKK